VAGSLETAYALKGRDCGPPNDVSANRFRAPFMAATDVLRRVEAPDPIRLVRMVNQMVS
jgi:hypothetical protein